MALIKCPECEKEVSDKALSCIGCGFPLSISNCDECGSILRENDSTCSNCGNPLNELENKDIVETINGIQFNITQLINNHKGRVDCIKTIRKLTGFGLADAKDAFDDICMRNYGDVDPY